MEIKISVTDYKAKMTSGKALVKISVFKVFWKIKILIYHYEDDHNNR